MKKINTFLITFVSCFSIIYLLININDLTLSRILILLSIIPVLFVIRIVRKVLKLQINDSTEFIYILFVIGAQLFGSGFELYHTLAYYDKIVHFLSGILSSVFALVLLNNTKIKNKSVVTDISIIIMFTLSVACLWECFEYISDLLLKGDSQHVLDTGINDTMQDMICAFTASITFSIIYFIKNKRLVKN